MNMYHTNSEYTLLNHDLLVNVYGGVPVNEVHKVQINWFINLKGVYLERRLTICRCTYKVLKCLSPGAITLQHIDAK